MLLALALWVAVHWWAVAGAIDKKLNALNGHEAAPGIRVSYAGKTISGFPFNIDVVFTGFKVEGEGAHGPFLWTTEHFALHRLTYGVAQDIYEAAGNQSLGWTDSSGAHHAVKFLPATLHASAGMDAKGLARFDLETVAAGGSDGDGKPFTAAHAQLHFRRDPKTDAVDLQVSGDDIKYGGRIGPFGGAIKSARFYVTLTKGSAFLPLLAGRESWAKAAADWRAQNGEVKLGPVAVSSEGLSLNSDAVGGDGLGLGALLDPLY